MKDIHKLQANVKNYFSNNKLQCELNIYFFKIILQFVRICLLVILDSEQTTRHLQIIKDSYKYSKNSI